MTYLLLETSHFEKIAIPFGEQVEYDDLIINCKGLVETCVLDNISKITKFCKAEKLIAKNSKLTIAFHTRLDIKFGGLEKGMLHLQTKTGKQGIIFNYSLLEVL